MRRFFIDLTMPGMGSSPKPPPAPEPPAPPPTYVDAQRVMGARPRSSGYAGAGRSAIRNEGGGLGLDVLNTTMRALKSLTGQ